MPAKPALPAHGTHGPALSRAGTARANEPSRSSLDAVFSASETTTLFGGELVLRQPARKAGYRVNADALILAAFAADAGRGRSTWDLGAGVGAVGLALLHRRAATSVVLVDSDPMVSELARWNAQQNGFSECVQIHQGDVERVARDHPGEASLVVCNPPYVAEGLGRPAAPVRRAARQGDIGVFVRAARRLCGRRGRACFVYPAPDVMRLVDALRGEGLEPKRCRFVHASADRPARIALVEALPAKPGSVRFEPPWFERVRGAPSPELWSWIEGR